LLRASRRIDRAIAIVDLVSGVIRRQHPVTVWQFVRRRLPHRKPLDQSQFVVNGTTLGCGYGSLLYSGCLTEGDTSYAANTSRVEQATLGAWRKY
jgi:hypothetical protein